MTFWAYILFASAALMFVMPLLPAIVEMLWPTDNAPLKVVREYDRNIRHFANGFRKFIDGNCRQVLEQPGTQGTLPNGTFYQVASEKGIIAPRAGDPIHQLILSPYALTLADDLFFEQELYSARSVTSGRANHFRALLAEDTIYLQEHSTVLRWVHTATALHVASGCRLFGRASADHRMILSQDCTFERLQAGCIEFGAPVVSKDADLFSTDNLVVVAELDGVSEHYGRRWIVRGDFEFPEYHYFDGDVIAKKAVHIGAGSYIKGSVKSNEDFYLGAHAYVEGSVVSAKNLYIGPGCHIKGPVVAENVIAIGEGTIIGADTVQTTVTAPTIIIELGTAVYGTVWASEDGQVRAPVHAQDKGFVPDRMVS